MLAIYGSMPPARRTRERGATSWALRQHHVGEYRGAAARCTPLFFSRETLFRAECAARLRHLILLTLYLRKCFVFQSVYYQRVIRVLIKISFCILQSVYFVPPSNIQKRAIQHLQIYISTVHEVL